MLVQVFDYSFLCRLCKNRCIKVQFSSNRGVTRLENCSYYMKESKTAVISKVAIPNDKAG